MSTLQTINIKHPSASTPTITFISSTNQATINAGSASAPVLSFIGDENTGLWSPGADTVAFSTGGVERLRIGSTGNVGVGTSSPSVAFHVSGQALVSANASGNAFEIRQTGSGNALVVEDSTNPDTSPFVVDSNGMVIVGATSSFEPTAGYSGQKLTVAGGDPIVVGRFDANTNPATVWMTKSRTGGVGSQAVLQSGDGIARFNFQGSDGTAFITAARIDVNVDGTPGTNDMPGRLVFSTTADGAASPTERMRITSAGNVGIGATAPSSLLHIQDITNTVTPLTVDSGSGADTTRGIAFNVSGANYGRILIPSGSGGAMALWTGTAGAAAERMRIDTSGNVGIGTNSPAANLHVQAADATYPITLLRSTSNTNFHGGTSRFQRQRGTTASPTIVADGDTLGALEFYGFDGTTFRAAASINAEVDATPGSSDMPGRLAFYTVADGGTSSSERLRINNAGLITGTGTSLGAWTAYTPTLGGTGWAIGNGSTAGYYCQIGKVIHFTARVTFGSTSTFGAGQLTVSLPVASSSVAARYVTGIFYDDSAASRYPATYEIDFGTSVAACYSPASPMTTVTSAAPFTWATNDLVRISGTYQAA